MTWSITDSPDVFRAEAGAFVASRPDLKLRTRTGYTADLPRAVTSAFHPPER